MSFEMGSFIELEYPNGKEYYKGDNVVRLNSGRTAIYHSIKSYNCKKVYLPIYQCETVKDFLIKKRIEIEFYTIDENFIPKMDTNEEDSCMIIVNYCGIFSTQYIKNIADKYKNVIIDNSQAFFSKPLENCLNVYSARKFFGVPDGAYVVGKPYLYSDDMYEDDHSSDTSLFLMQRIEYGCEGKAYASRTLNEERIDNSDIKNMSKFTRYLLDGIDYENVKKKRIENFNVVRSMLKEKNILDIDKYFDEDCVPMVYPFMIENENLLDYLLENKHFQGNWWRYILDITSKNSMEYRLSKYMIPLTIDQRYTAEDVKILCDKILKFI
ncbi:MAG: hypothetical protein IAC55_05855 [Tyzzerella sp.]|uniref:DegT/DnrJ/EryC1/StrS aminotransferase family protein n=1 Tax=Candidatus Fimicola merdigallinarum TaxID=2840819 RepID=A0A9D9H134_9FIRM|nr:hypothetical protein [Candidatus Fimicola merdigallinarum]